MKKFLKMSSSALFVSLFALFVGKKLDDKIADSRRDTSSDRGVEKID